MNWQIHSFLKYEKELNLFISNKKQFEKYILLGQKDLSKEKLNNIKDISYSIWGLENKYLYTQLFHGLESNLNLQSKILERKIEPEVNFINHFLSYKVEEDPSYFSYKTSLDGSLKDLPEAYKEYFSYRLDINYNFNDIRYLFSIVNRQSIIDRYMLFRDLIFYLTIEDKYPTESLELKKIASLIDDHLLKNSLLLNLKKIDQLPNNIKLELLIDNYTLGKYEDVILFVKNNIDTLDLSFFIIEFYVKSHIHLNKDISLLTEKNSIINQIIKLTFEILKMNEKTNESMVDLLTLTNSISSFDISKELISFISFNYGEVFEKIPEKRKFIYSNLKTPIQFKVFEKNENQLAFLNLFKENKTASFFRSIIDNSFNDSLSLIPDIRISFYKGVNHYKSKEYIKASKIFEKLTLKVSNINYLYEQTVLILFECYFYLKKHDLAINLYSEVYLKNKQLIKRVESYKLTSEIINNKWKSIKHNNISFPIYIYLTSKDEFSHFVSYDLYMRSQNKNYPSQLFDKQNLTSKEIFFLEKLCSIKTISKKAIVFKNTNEVMNERLSICQQLLKKNNKKDYIYNDEISEITQILSVKQRIKEVDESKIYVDEEGIKNNELKEVKKSFNRFRKFSELIREKKIFSQTLNIDSLVKLLINEGNDTIRKSDLQYLLFTEIYIEIRDKFLFSNKYGLEYYVSQRIRHGTIIGQLRKQFKEHLLVTTKQSKTNEYLTNQHWAKNINYKNDNQKNKLLDRLNIFSLIIDTTINKLKDNNIQIRTEKKNTSDTGWFDYSFDYTNRRYLFLKVKDIEDFDDFVNEIFTSLWERTSFNLEEIRRSIKTGFKDSLLKELDSLEKDIKSIFSDEKPNYNIYRYISDCRTKIQLDIDYVANWFNKSKNYEIDFTIEDAFMTSFKIVNNIISPLSIELEKNIKKSEIIIKGYYFTHFVDLIKIFISNISDYYIKNNVKKMAFEADIQEGEDLLKINFKNKLIPNEDITKLKRDIQKISIDLDSSNYTQTRKEKGTGFYKANNIIKNVFRNNTNKLALNIDEKFNVMCHISLANLKKI